jgi:hypothetical protein
MFEEIFSQAMEAESHGLGEIAVCGYRRALEFLIKDYCISKDSGAKATIEKEFLGACINNRVKDANIKACATRAAWLGNDETHYVRRWTNKDINDLKTLINLTMNWIVNEVLTNKYLDEMSAPGPP